MRRVESSGFDGGIGSAFEQAGKPAIGAGRSNAKKKPPSPITLRLTDDERKKLKVAAEGMSQSAYIRACLFERRASKRAVPSSDRVVLAQILARLGESRMANNLNQIAYHANCGSLVIDDATEAEIKEACASIAWIRVKLIEALGLKNGKRS